MKFGWYHQPNWDWRAAGNFMFGGAGGALLAMTAAASWPGNPPLPLALAALAFVGLGLFLVWLEIGRPWRAMHVFFHPQTSWMTREAFVSVVVFALALAGIALQVPWVLALAGLTGLLFLYCQARILHMAKGIPAWREPAIVPLIFTTGLTEGTGVLLLVLAALGVVPPWALWVLLALVVLRIGAWRYYRRRLEVAEAPKPAQARLARIDAVVVWLGSALAGALAIAALTLPGAVAVLAALAGAVAAVGGWYMKFNIVVRAAQVQGYGVGKRRRGHPLGLRPSSSPG